MDAIEIKWNNVKLIKSKIDSSAGKVPLLSYIPHKNTSSEIIIALHYQTGSKEIWLDEEENQAILKYAIEKNMPFYAIDLYGHGDWQSDDEKFDTEDIGDDHWDQFVEDSVSGVEGLINSLDATKKVNFVCSSTGCLIAVKAIASGITPNSIIMASPVPYKSYDDQYSFHNNVSTLKDLNVLILTGKNDEDVEDDEVQWFFNLLESENKEIIFFESGHELPKDWSQRAISFLEDISSHIN